MFLSHSTITIRDSSASIASSYELDGRGSIPGSGKRFFFYSTPSRPALGPTQPPIQLVSGVKRSGLEANHLPRSSVEIKNGGAMPPLPHTSSWRSAELFKQRDNFTFFTLPLDVIQF
jgi:hypothetical protein